MLKKFISFLMATAVAVSFSMSAVAEEAVEDAEELDYSYLYNDDHDHGYDEVADIFANTLATTGCPHSIIQAGTYTGSEYGGYHTFSYNGSLYSCNITINYNYTSYICGYSGCDYSTTTKTKTGSHHSNSKCSA